MKFTIAPIACLSAGTAAQVNITVPTTLAANFNAVLSGSAGFEVDPDTKAKIMKELEKLNKMTDVDLKKEIVRPLMQAIENAFNQEDVDPTVEEALETEIVEELKAIDVVVGNNGVTPSVIPTPATSAVPVATPTTPVHV